MKWFLASCKLFVLLSALSGCSGSSGTTTSSTTIPSPTITSFTPATGVVGATVTITGTNFSTTTANNTVKFNGTPATITGTPTATSIVTTVPAGTPNGPITVAVGGVTATSATNFTVAAASDPTITSFTPATGVAGDTVTITGTNFSTTAANNTVKFNGTTATITGTPTATSIVTTIPTGATTGPITVAVGAVTATSATNYTVTPPQPAGTAKKMLWIGNSVTHGHYYPVLTYKNDTVTDECIANNVPNYISYGSGIKIGGIPAIFQMFASQKGLNFDIHLLVASSRSLLQETNPDSAANPTYYKVFPPLYNKLISQAGWDIVVLQEQTDQGLTVPPTQFNTSVKFIEAGIHAVNPTAKIYLYENWPKDSADPTSNASEHITYHNAFYSAAGAGSNIAGVTASGDAWWRAWQEGYANEIVSVPSSLPQLWHLGTDSSQTATDFTHPSVYGAYLSALVHFQKITGIDVRTFGGGETAANDLGISPAIAINLQKVAWETVTNESSALLQ